MTPNDPTPPEPVRLDGDRYSEQYGQWTDIGLALSELSLIQGSARGSITITLTHLAVARLRALLGAAISIRPMEPVPAPDGWTVEPPDDAESSSFAPDPICPNSANHDDLADECPKCDYDPTLPAKLEVFRRRMSGEDVRDARAVVEGLVKAVEDLIFKPPYRSKAEGGVEERVRAALAAGRAFLDGAGADAGTERES